MLIAQLEPAHISRGGDWYYRTFSPGAALSHSDDVYVVDLTNIHRTRDAIVDQADLLIVNMVCDPDLLPLVARRNARGQLTVYEVNDDVACMQAWNPAAAFYNNPDHQVLFRMLIHASGAAQFCTPELLRIYGRLAATTATFPNQMAREVPSASGQNSAKTVVVGWGGSVGHFQDIANVAPALVDWVSQHPEVVLHLMCAEKIAELFQALPHEKKKIVPTGTIDDYHDFVAGLDIGLAPLEDTGFNRCRSDVKFLEYGLHGVVPVVRALAPYERTVRHKHTGFLFHDTSGMLMCLDDLLDQPALRAAVGAAAQAYVRSERSEEAHAADRLDWYRSLRSKRQSSSLLPNEGKDLFEALRKLEGAEVQGRHVTLDPTRYELLVHEALVIGQMHARRQEALSALREATRLQPTAYQPHLFGASMSTHPIQWLEEALQKNPSSLKARIMLAEQHAAAGRSEPAIKTLLAAAEAYPGWDIPYSKLAEFMNRWNQPTEAEHFFEAALAIRQPYVQG